MPLQPNERWSLDFVADQMTDGRRFRILAVVDHCTRECLTLVPDTSLSGARVARERDTIVGQRGRPTSLVSDNGTKFELTDPTRDALAAWLKKRGLRSGDWLFPIRSHPGNHVTTRQYSRLVDEWVGLAGLDTAAYGTHSLRRAKVALVYKRTGNCAPANSCSATPNWRAQSAISASRSTMRSPCRSRPTSDEVSGGPAPPQLAELGDKLS